MNISAKLAAAALAATIIGAAVGAPAQAECCDPLPPPKHCDFTFKSLKAVNLWDDGDSDFVAFQVKGNNFPGGGQSVEFFKGTVHTAAAFNYPAATATLIVRSFALNVVMDEPWPLANVTVAPQDQLMCGDTGQTGTNETLTFTNGDAEYLLTYDMSLPHL
jgi:hypothetical protein